MAPLSVEAIFFDIDGTLVDSTADIVIAVNYTLREMGFAERSRGEIVSYIGTGVRDLISKSAGSGDSRLVDKGTALYASYYMRHAVDHAILYPHVVETLAYLKKIRKFILTNRYSDFADATLRGLGLSGYFEEILGGDDENCLKPSACLIDRALPRLGVNKAAALIVGDMSVDVETGHNSGIRTCFVTYGLGRKEDLGGAKPDFIIDDISELKKIISEP